MKLASSAQMKSIDSRTIGEFNIPRLNLMEKAGLGTAELCQKILGDPRGKKVLVFCGTGNNGGDGLVVGRYLAKWKYRVQFFFFGEKGGVKRDALTNLNRTMKLKLPMKIVSKSEDLPEQFSCHLIVDAIFGTGFKGEVTGLEKETIERMNRSKVPVVAVDISSGLNADNGSFNPVCVRDTATSTMGL